MGPLGLVSREWRACLPPNSISGRIARYATKRQPKSLDPVRMSFASYEMTRSQAQPPLLVMHGIFGSKANWNTLCKEFHRRTKRKVVAVDARNHGDSPHTADHTYEHLAEDTRALMKELNIEKAALLGHSMGGRAMMYFALKYPELVEKLVVTDISPITSSHSFKSMPALMGLLLRVRLPRGVTVSAARINADLQLSRNITNKGVRSFLLTNLVQKPDGSYAWRMNLRALLTNFPTHIVRFPDVNNYKYTGPVLFVAGGASDFIQKSDHRPILKLFPRAEFREIAGAGHWVHSEKPVQFLAVCLEFLNRRADKN